MYVTVEWPENTKFLFAIKSELKKQKQFVRKTAL